MKIAHKTDIGGVLVDLVGRHQIVESFRKLAGVAEKLGVRGDGIVDKLERAAPPL